MESNNMKYMKGTTTVGVVCSDGVVIGADTRATMGGYIASNDTRKIFRIDSNLGMTIAGSEGDAQELIRVMRAQNEIYKMNENRPMSPKSATSLLSIILQNNKMMPYYVQLLVAGLDDNEPEVYSLDPIGGYSEERNFTVTGSGTEIAAGYLEETYKKGLTTKEAIKLVARALAIATKRNAYTGDSVMIATINRSGYNEYTGKDLERMLTAK
jgi:proteasome beta subunit